MSAFTGLPDYKTVNDLYLKTEEWITRENAARLFNRQASAGDGNCLFNSLSISLWDSYAVNVSPGDIRQRVCKYYKEATAEIDGIIQKSGITLASINLPPKLYVGTKFERDSNDNDKMSEFKTTVQKYVRQHIKGCIVADGGNSNIEHLSPYSTADLILGIYFEESVGSDSMKTHIQNICNDTVHGQQQDIITSTIVIGCNIVVLAVVGSNPNLMVFRHKLYDDGSPPLFVILTGDSGKGKTGHYDCLIPKDNTIERKGAGTFPTGIFEDLKPIHPMSGGAANPWSTHVQPILHGGTGRRRAVPWA